MRIGRAEHQSAMDHPACEQMNRWQLARGGGGGRRGGGGHICNTQHTTHNTQHTTHNTQHTTHNTQHTQHTAHNTPNTPTTQPPHTRACYSPALCCSGVLQWCAAVVVVSCHTYKGSTLMFGLKRLMASAETFALDCPTCSFWKKNCLLRLVTSIVSRSICTAHGARRTVHGPRAQWWTRRMNRPVSTGGSGSRMRLGGCDRKEWSACFGCSCILSGNTLYMSVFCISLCAMST